MKEYQGLRSLVLSTPENLFDIGKALYPNSETEKEDDSPEGCATIRQYMGVVCEKLKEIVPTLEMCAFWCASCTEKHHAIWEGGSR